MWGRGRRTHGRTQLLELARKLVQCRSERVGIFVCLVGRFPNRRNAAHREVSAKRGLDIFQIGHERLHRRLELCVAFVNVSKLLFDLRFAFCADLFKLFIFDLGQLHIPRFEVVGGPNVHVLDLEANVFHPRLEIADRAVELLVFWHEIALRIRDQVAQSSGHRIDFGFAGRDTVGGFRETGGSARRFLIITGSAPGQGDEDRGKHEAREQADNSFCIHRGYFGFPQRPTASGKSEKRSQRSLSGALELAVSAPVSSAGPCLPITGCLIAASAYSTAAG